MYSDSLTGATQHIADLRAAADRAALRRAVRPTQSLVTRLRQARTSR